ncbi:DUF433 domain-containing protein [Oxalobacteraceae bacterium A2-2]
MPTTSMESRWSGLMVWPPDPDLDDDDLSYDPAHMINPVRTINGRVIPPRRSPDDPIDEEVLAYYRSLVPTVEMDRKVLCGMPVFRGTLVPVKLMFDYLGSGRTISDFVADHPAVSSDTACATFDNPAVLFYEQRSAEACARLARSAGNQQGD